MATLITPRLIELTYEAVLKSYWRKQALRKFLKASKISENFLSSWEKDESKREMLDRLFQKLQTTDNGKAIIFQMARNLSEQITFPDLRGWEDSTKKIEIANKSVQELKYYLKKQDETLKNEKQKKEVQEKYREERIKMQRSLTDKTKLKDNLDTLFSKIGTQEGGYSFEKWFYELLDFCEITNRKPYKTDGRQIDGSLTLEGTTYLVELKFTKNQSDATVIDSLKAKVNKMADNTMGIIISMSGYSSVAMKEASGSKTTLLILDARHLYLYFLGTQNFSDIVSRVRRHVSQTGEAYLDVNQFDG
jgi:hypothetical protein